MQDRLRNLLPGLCANPLRASTLQALPVGLATALNQGSAMIAFGSLIFSGALAPYSSQGIGLVLFANFCAGLIIAAACGYRGAIAGLSPVLVIVMATIASTIELQGKELFVTAVGALTISAVATGVCCFMIG